MKVSLVTNILKANERIAEQNKKLFDEKGILVLNMMSAPGAGKTTIISKTILALEKDFRVGVIEGDIQSTYDAEKISETGAQVVQINTGGACHLDGNMIRETFDDLDLDAIDILIVENVGNLVCPAEFNVGEDFKAMLLSVPEGDDKPLKYPLMFHESSALLVNKIDLLPYVNCSVDKIREESLKINPKLAIFEVSATNNTGLDQWFAWLRKQKNDKDLSLKSNR
ncbi:MAG: hydrogenase nickel incorporation protein HypB [candidate division KSB1 bacterium]|jgi:hydrogenase nickel incorporation protein HypB|nr:hydrogenase nickel incorporation protein HypB [candidate division KSB1 bacterium]